LPAPDAATPARNAYLDTTVDAIRNSQVNVRRVLARHQVRRGSSDRIETHRAEMLISVACAIHADGQVRHEAGALLPIAFPLQTCSQEVPRFIGFMPKPIISQGIAPLHISAISVARNSSGRVVLEEWPLPVTPT